MTARRRVPGLDGLRAVAVLAVIAFHVTPAWLPGGFLGVDVFFVLSGYLITVLLIDEHRRTGRIAPAAFWSRRLRRLVPALVAMLLACCAAAAVVGGDVLVALRRQVLGALTFTGNWLSVGAGDDYVEALTPQLFTHLWSLAVEEQFYVLWPALLIVALRLGRRRPLAASLCALLGLGSAAALVAGQLLGWSPSRLHFGTDTHVVGLMAGALTAALSMGVAGPRGRRVWAVLGTRSSAVGVIGVAGLGLALIALSWEHAPSRISGLLLASAATCGIVLAVVRGGALAWTLSRTPLVWIGRRSYGLYLWHWPMLLLGEALWSRLQPGRPEPWAVPALAVLVATVCAALSYRFLELPVLRDGMRSCALRAWRWSRQGRDSRLFNPRGWVLATGLGLLLTGTAVAVVAAPARSETAAQIEAGRLLAEATREGITGTGRPPAGGDLPPFLADGDVWRTGPSEPTGEQLPSGPPPPPGTTGPAGAQPGLPAPPTDPPPALPVPPPPAPAGETITVVGDSVALASAQALTETLPGVLIDAAVSRMPGHAPEVMDALSAAGGLRPVVVVALATNGRLTPEILQSALDRAGPDRHVVLVTAHADRAWVATNNDLLRGAAAADPRVAVADWDAAISARPDLLARDGIHPSAEGGRVFAQVVVDAFAQFSAP